jgi:prepilin-type N-terminal cleavage/methylation domain-containing protein
MLEGNHKAFTMIELIFVIVIIGILAAIAIPKLAGVTNEAQKNNILAFMGTSNRTIAPILWSNNLPTHNGSIKSVSDETFLNSYSAVPVGVENIDLSQCADANASNGSKIADITTEALPVAEEVFCIDGDSTHAPKFAFSADMNVLLQHN